MSIIIKAKIEDLTYRPGQLTNSNSLKEYPFSRFDINSSDSCGIVKINDNNKIAFSKWVSPKRTRSYPFARIYDTYNFGGKRVTIIPVIKDEGMGASRNKSNNDRINYITLSWMNLTNIYVILAWYTGATKKNEYRITDQIFDKNYVRNKIKEINEFQLDAHHWNNRHFRNDFAGVYKSAVNAYIKISKELSVKMHDFSDHMKFLKEILSEDKKTISLSKFAEKTLGKSKMAAERETCVQHKHESLSLETEKPIFEMINNLGGKYYLTCDEISIDRKNKKIIIRECKNATGDKLPKIADIKDGLFKILLFSQIKSLMFENERYTYSVELKLTGLLTSQLILPNTATKIDNFVMTENMSSSDIKIIKELYEEAKLNNYRISIGD